MTKSKLIAEKNFMHNGAMMEVGEEFTVNASEVSEYVNNGLAKEMETKVAPKRATKKADVEFGTEIGANNTEEFANDLTANATNNLGQAMSTNSFTNQPNQNQKEQ